MSTRLTAEQVREAIFNGSSYASYDGAKYYADGIGMQAIADELNAALSGGECEMEPSFTVPSRLDFMQEYRCTECDEYAYLQIATDDDALRFCPNCGKAVKR